MSNQFETDKGQVFVFSGNSQEEGKVCACGGNCKCKSEPKESSECGSDCGCK